MGFELLQNPANRIIKRDLGPLTDFNFAVHAPPFPIFSLSLVAIALDEKKPIARSLIVFDIDMGIGAAQERIAPVPGRGDGELHLNNLNDVVADKDGFFSGKVPKAKPLVIEFAEGKGFDLTIRFDLARQPAPGGEADGEQKEESGSNPVTHDCKTTDSLAERNGGFAPGEGFCHRSGHGRNSVIAPGVHAGRVESQRIAVGADGTIPQMV